MVKATRSCIGQDLEDWKENIAKSCGNGNILQTYSRFSKTITLSYVEYGKYYLLA